MVKKEHILLLNDELKKILQLELQAGNTIAETAILRIFENRTQSFVYISQKTFFDSHTKKYARNNIYRSQ